jgi:hypothetical protein
LVLFFLSLESTQKARRIRKKEKITVKKEFETILEKYQKTTQISQEEIYSRNERVDGRG